MNITRSGNTLQVQCDSEVSAACVLRILEAVENISRKNESPAAIPASANKAERQSQGQQDCSGAGVVRLSELPVLTRLSEALAADKKAWVVYQGPIPYQGLTRFHPQCTLNRILRSLSLRWLLLRELPQSWFKRCRTQDASITQPEATHAGKLLGSIRLAEWLGLSVSQWDGSYFDSPMRFQLVLTQKEVLDAKGRIVRREVPCQNPIQGLRPGDRLVGKRDHTGFSKVLCGLPPLLLTRLFWRRISWTFRK
jgi:hypothetical protein